MEYQESRNSQPERSQIEYWETTDTIVDEFFDDGPFPLSFVVTSEKPVFENGDQGFYRVNTTIKVGSYYIRLATKSLTRLLGIIRDNRSRILDAVDDVRDMNSEKERNSGPNNRKRTRTAAAAPEDKQLDDDFLDSSRPERGHSFRPGGRSRSFSPRGDRR